jgi:hypothetical protein
MKESRRKSKNSNSSNGTKIHTQSQTTRTNLSNQGIVNSAGEIGIFHTASQFKSKHNHLKKKDSGFKFDRFIENSDPFYTSGKGKKKYLFEHLLYLYLMIKKNSMI